jgi:hypothetical protein
MDSSCSSLLSDAGINELVTTSSMYVLSQQEDYALTRAK